MPERNKIDWDQLTSQEIAAIQSVGVEMPDEASTPRSEQLPPAQPAASGIEDDKYEAGIPGEPDYRDRLRGYSTHVDKIAGTHQEMKGKAEQDALKSAKSKIKSTDQRRREEIRDAREELNREIKAKAVNSWADAAAGWISKSKR